MSLKRVSKITEAELKTKGVSALATRPNSHSAQYGNSGLSAAELKAWFDKLGILLSTRLNDLVDKLGKENACEYIAIPKTIFEKEGEYSLLDFLNLFANGEITNHLKAFKNQGAVVPQSLQSLLFDIDAKTSSNDECISINNGMIVDLTNIVNQNAEMCSSNSKDADGNIVSHKEILGKVEEAMETSTVGTAQAKKHAEEKVMEHNTSFNSHADMRATITTALEKAQEAYNLAAGKSKVHPMNSFDDFKSSIETESGRYNVGDMFMFKDNLLPDLILFEKNVVYDSSIDDFYLDDSPFLSEMEPGMTYFLFGNRFVSIESGMDVSKFTTKEEHLSDVLSLNSMIETNSEMIRNVAENSATKEKVETLEEEIAKKDERMAYYDTETSNIIELEDYAEYDLGQRLELTVELPEETSPLYCCIFNFYAGETPTAFDAPDSIYFVGDDCLDGTFYPLNYRGYEVNVKKLWGICVARVGAFDFHLLGA